MLSFVFCSLTRCKIEVFVLSSFTCFPEFPLTGCCLLSYQVFCKVGYTCTRHHSLAVRRQLTTTSKPLLFTYLCVYTYSHLLTSCTLPLFVLFFQIHAIHCLLRFYRSFLIFHEKQTPRQILVVRDLYLNEDMPIPRCSSSTMPACCRWPYCCCC